MKIKLTIELSNDQIHDIADVIRRGHNLMTACDKAIKTISADYYIIHDITTAIINAEKRI